MDIFIEEMVARKRTFGQFLTKLGIFAAGLIIAFVLLYVLPLFIPPQFGSILFIFAVAVLYLAYRIAISFNLEFEYSLVNTEIDIDKIINRRKRKRVTTAQIRGCEAFGRVGENVGDFGKYKNDFSVKKIFACFDKNSAENYFVVYLENNERKMLVFSPSEKIVEVIEKFNPKRV